MPPAPVLYVSDFADPADAFDVAYLARSPEHDLLGVVGAENAILPAQTDPPRWPDLESALDAAEGPVNLVVAARHGVVNGAIAADRDAFRAKVARCFVVGGHANDYGAGVARLPIDPRLRERHPERFAPGGDPRVADPEALDALLGSGEAVIWLPRDLCLWRYAAPQILEIEPNPCTASLVRIAADALGEGSPVLLSCAPAFCLAFRPDPMPWLRLFRTAAARRAPDGAFAIGDPRPNLFLVTAIDGFALGRRLTAVLRGDG